MKKLSFLLFLSFTGLNALAQSNVVAIQEVSNMNSGIVYALPKTMLHINVEITTTYKIAAPYAKYAKIYFNLNNSEIITYKSETIEISGINIAEKGIVDPNRTYLVKTKAASNANLIQINENGIIVGVNAPIVEQASDKKKICDKNKLDFSYDKNDLTENYFSASSNEKAADIVASQIYAIRESKMDLVTGNADYAPADVASLQLMLTELNKQEARLMELFVGKTIKETKTKTFELNPRENIYKNILCYFSNQNGISDKDDESAKPVYMSLSSNKNDFFRFEKKGIFKSATKGLVYCLPGSADIEINDDENVYYKGTVNVAQFGTTLSFPAKFLDKKKHVKIVYNAATGAIESIND